MAKKNREPLIGSNFELDVYDGKVSLLREATRTIVTVSIIVGCLASLFIAAFVLDPSGENGTALSIWSATAMPIGGVVGYYLRGPKENVERNY